MSTLFEFHFAADLSEFTSTSGAGITQAAGAGLAGTTGGVSITFSGTTAQYGYKTISVPASGKLRFRWYIDPNSITIPASASFVTCCAYANGGTPNILCGAHLIQGFAMRGFIFNDANAYTATASDYAITDAPHYAELYLQRATGSAASDGSCAFYIDGTLKDTITGIDNYDAWSGITDLRGGAVSSIDSGTSGTFYFDEFKANDDGGAIGAYVAPSTGALHRLVSPVRLGMLIRGGLAL